MISFSLPRTFGRMVGDKRQGYAIVAVMAVLAIASIVAINAVQLAHHGTVPTAVGAATEGTEARFGVPDSATFASSTTLTSTGSVDSFHDSYTSLGGAVTMGNMMLGEVAPGGTGSGLYGILVLAVLTVFVAGLMVGRTPEYLGKKIGAPRGQAGVAVLPDDAGAGAGRYRRRDGDARDQRSAMLNHGRARPVRGAVRVHLGNQQQRLRVRRHLGQHAPGTTPRSAWPC